MKKFLPYVVLCIITILIPSIVFPLGPQIDSSKEMSEHAVLILGLLFPILGIVGAILKLAYDKMMNVINEKTKEANAQEDRAYDAELKLKEQEIKQLKERLDKIETEQHICNRSLPLSYVTRAEYDKFAEQHKNDLNGITNRLENMMKDLKNELKNDMQENINRIISLLNEIIKKSD